MGVTLVTGASAGIGRSLAKRLARHGDAMALIARQPAALESLAAELQAEGVRALAVPCDVTDYAQVRAAVARIESELGPVTRLVANAGGGERTPVTAFDAEAVAHIVQLNLLGVANCVAAVLPGMLAARGGHLVAMGSLAGRRGLPAAAAYSAAKAGVANLMESLRVDLRGAGIAVTLLEPGFVRTKPGHDNWRKRLRKPMRLQLEDATARMERAILARRRHLALPWPLVGTINALRLLPLSLYDRLLAGRGSVQKRN